MADLEGLKDAVIKGDQNSAKDITTQAIDEGMDPESILNTGLIAGMNVIGAAFKKNEVYVPEVLISARAMKTAMDLGGEVIEWDVVVGLPVMDGLVGHHHAEEEDEGGMEGHDDDG